MRKLIHIMAVSIIMAIPATALAWGDEWPLSECTNAFEYYTPREQYGVVSQLVWGTFERFLADPVVEITKSTFTLTFSGTSSQTSLVTVVTNGDVVTTYTNWYNTETNVSLTVVSTNPVTWTNLNPYVYTYASTTVTAYPSLSASFFAALVREMFREEDDADDLSQCENYVATNFMVGGNYNTYLAREDGSGNSPDDFPMNSRAGIFYRDGIGYTNSPLSTNFWGLVNGGESYWTVAPSNAGHTTLYESHYTTNGWTNYAMSGYGAAYDADAGSASLVRNNTNIMPVLRYGKGGTNAHVNFDVIVQGTAFQWTNRAQWSTKIATSETVTVIGATQALSESWYAVTNMVITNTPADTHDVVWAEYQAGDTFYYTPNFIDRLSDDVLDEYWRAIKALIYTRTTPTWTAKGSGNCYVWSGDSTSSWAAAITAASNATPVVTTNDGAPECYFQGYQPATGHWYVVVQSMQAWPVVTADTNAARAFDHYFSGKDPTAPAGGGATQTEYTNCGTGILKGKLSYISADAATVAGTVTSGTAIGSISWPEDYTDEPGVGSNFVQGFVVLDSRTLVKWNVANGFDHQ